MRTIICTNNDGYTLSFSESVFSPFLLASTDGLYDAINSVSVSQNTMSDGGTYQGSVAKYRTIVLTLKQEPSLRYFQANRDILNQLFKKDELGTLRYIEDDVERVIGYYVEKVEPTMKKGNFNVTLKCPDPFFYDPKYKKVSMATWIPAFTFPHRFKMENLGYKSNVKMQNIRNDTATEDIGMIITISVDGDVTNPVITHVEKDEHTAVGSTTKPLYLERGDKLIISSEKNNKRVWLISNNVKIEINEYLTEDSEFLTLQRGDNNIGYDADEGVDYISVDIEYRFRYASA